MAKNITSDPQPPHDIESKAKKMLEALLRKERISRKNCDLFGIANPNDSIHSIASYLRNKKLIPLISDREGRGVVTYHMNDNEILRHNNPDQREQQKFEMRIEIERKRKLKVIKQLEKMIEIERKKKSPDKRFLKKLNQIINQK